MDVVIIGENKKNDLVSGYFAKRGVESVIVSDVYELRCLKGEAGDFKVCTKDFEIEADFVILTEQPSALPLEIDGLSLMSVYDDKRCEALVKASAEQPVVFLLDYVCESPLSATIQALNDAAELASLKRQVYYLAKFIRTAGKGVEALYKKARGAGVNFIKYQDLQITADLAREEFLLRATDTLQVTELRTKSVYSDGSRDVGERFAFIMKKLKLTKNKLGSLTTDSFYLTPVLTSRRGVYHIPRDIEAEQMIEGLEYIYTATQSDLTEPPSCGSAVVDSLKCVFCYNCYRACPHAAMEPDPNACIMRCLPAACAGCGTCASICPANAISLEEFEPDAAGAILLEELESEPAGAIDLEQVDSGATLADIDPALSCRKNRALVICCENAAAAIIEKSLAALGQPLATLEQSIAALGPDAFDIETLSVPCGGLISFEQLSDGLGAYDKVISVVCPVDACRHFDGNKRACAQTGRLQKMLEAAGMESGRVHVALVSHAMPGVLTDELRGFLYAADSAAVSADNTAGNAASGGEEK